MNRWIAILRRRFTCLHFNTISGSQIVVGFNYTDQGIFLKLNYQTWNSAECLIQDEEDSLEMTSLLIKSYTLGFLQSFSLSNCSSKSRKIQKFLHFPCENQIYVEAPTLFFYLMFCFSKFTRNLEKCLRRGGMQTVYYINVQSWNS